MKNQTGIFSTVNCPLQVKKIVKMIYLKFWNYILKRVSVTLYQELLLLLGELELPLGELFELPISITPHNYSPKE